MSKVGLLGSSPSYLVPFSSNERAVPKRKKSGKQKVKAKYNRKKKAVKKKILGNQVGRGKRKSKTSKSRSKLQFGGGKGKSKKKKQITKKKKTKKKT
jgi:hypothetical protein